MGGHKLNPHYIEPAKTEGKAINFPNNNTEDIESTEIGKTEYSEEIPEARGGKGYAKA